MGSTGYALATSRNVGSRRVPTVSELIPEAGNRAGWKVDRITQACFGAQTGVAALPIVFIRTADHTTGAARCSTCVCRSPKPSRITQCES